MRVGALGVLLLAGVAEAQSEEQAAAGQAAFDRNWHAMSFHAPSRQLIVPLSQTWVSPVARIPSALPVLAAAPRTAAPGCDSLVRGAPTS
jgi:hypothetical protein